jgi:propanol-preferring alcohol dehydrogenase
MKAAVFRTQGEPLSIEDVATPEPSGGEVLVKIAAAGVCHSDLHQVHGSIPPYQMPIILGHENAGWVEKLGPEAEGFAPGDPVVIFGGWGCGRCKYCLGGEEQLCGNERWSGVGVDGGFAEYLLVPSVRHLIHADGVDLVDMAALTDAGLTPYRAVKKTLPSLLPGSTVLLIGAGGLGQYGIQFLRLLTQAKIIVVETAPDKRELASELGADIVLDGTASDVLERVRAEAGGEGVDAALDFVGIDSTMTLARDALARKGVLVLVGLAGGSARFAFLEMASEAQLITSTWGSRNDLAELVELARTGKVRTSVERYPLEDVNEVLGRLERGEISGRAVLIP